MKWKEDERVDRVCNTRMSEVVQRSPLIDRRGISTSLYTSWSHDLTLAGTMICR